MTVIPELFIGFRVEGLVRVVWFMRVYVAQKKNEIELRLHEFCGKRGMGKKWSVAVRELLW